MTVAILPHDDAETQVWATALEVARLFPTCRGSCVRSELKAADRQALGRVGPLADESHGAWRAVPDPGDAQAAFSRLSD